MKLAWNEQKNKMSDVKGKEIHDELTDYLCQHSFDVERGQTKKVIVDGYQRLIR
ncbi:hypothetical protein ACP21Z_11340 [Staphylococcus epidermidis]|uniref:hypothetical protein n=1 Tax=Staphylococcus TaxID=1279 RepID=UPI0012F65A5B|nr:MULTISPECIES: hypothetical protein [Staphylococcus]MDU6032222.1 hypothetical protein [Peptoniphilus harei]HCY6687737.1 hypothetical protein [Staphylococcus aureus]MBM5972864.1 hypothetical protein [Staphylococcus epidermidis]MBM5992696.1 hypothetical protein [Staphylococcus epidermidis]MBM6017453.1 hypothetical protein [Staphylococcus epidermidis]